jgi:hypothetical protein
MEARLKSQCYPDLAEDEPSKLEPILKDQHSPDLSADAGGSRQTHRFAGQDR